MAPIRSLLAVVTAPVGILVLCLSTSAQAAGGAFVVDDTEIAKPGRCKIESRASFASNADFLGVTSPACVANLGAPVELSFSLARFRSDGDGDLNSRSRARPTSFRPR